MNLRVVGILLGFLGVLVACGEPAAPPITLELNPEVGAVYDVEAQIEVYNYYFDWQSAPYAIMTTTNLFEYQVASSSEQEVHVTTTMSSNLSEFNLEGRTFSQNSFEFITEHSPNLSQSYEKLKGQLHSPVEFDQAIQLVFYVEPVELVYTPHGKLLDIPQLSELVNIYQQSNVLQEEVPAPESFRDLQVSNIPYILYETIAVMPEYPEQPVTIGDSWVTPVYLFSHREYGVYAAFTETITYTLSKVENGIAFVDIAGRADSGFTLSLFGELNLLKQPVAPNNRVGHALTETGQLRLDLATGWPLSIERKRELFALELHGETSEVVRREHVLTSNFRFTSTQQ